MSSDSPSQPSPKNLYPEMDPTWDQVIRDMKARDAVGRERYGVPLLPCNGRNSALDAYEEALDMTAYLKNLMLERKFVVEFLQDSLVNSLNAETEWVCKSTLEMLGAENDVDVLRKQTEVISGS